jgi:hypothetical protein
VLRTKNANLLRPMLWALIGLSNGNAAIGFNVSHTYHYAYFLGVGSLVFD